MTASRIRVFWADPLTAAVAAIAAGTVAAGLFQMVLPGVVLGVIDGNDDVTAKHFFAIVGMFMAIIGSLVLHSIWLDEARRLVVGWGAVQKFGASIAVALGVANDVFSGLALLVAAFDLLSGVLMAVYARRRTGDGAQMASRRTGDGAQMASRRTGDGAQTTRGQ